MKTKVPEDLAAVKPGALADLLYTLREERSAHNTIVDEIKEQENRIEQYLIDTMPKADLNGLVGKLARVSLKRTLIPQVKDWDALYAFIAKKKAWDLLQRRPSSTAFQERWEAQVAVPGVEQFTKLGLSVTKAAASRVLKK